MLRIIKSSLFIITILSSWFTGCNEEVSKPQVELISAKVNGHQATGTLTDIPLDLSVELVFSSAVDKAALTELISLTEGSNLVPFEVTLTSANSRALITASLSYQTSYHFEVSPGSIGANEEKLSTAIRVSFTTVEDELVRSMAPCTGSSNCQQSVWLSHSSTRAEFKFFANYPIYLENARWEKLKQAIIVVHGQNRDANNYYEYLAHTLSSLSLDEETVLLAPWFMSPADAPPQTFHWSSSSWREGQNSGGDVQLSSFAIVDSLIAQLRQTELFPAMEQIIITGHSSGGLFTHVYAAANASDTSNPTDMKYVVANSQYFYYPTAYRLDESTGEYYQPSECVGYDSWPLGFANHPAYMGTIDEEPFNNRFAEREVIYLLGNNTDNDGALNTSDCQATLLGSSRYQRGENMYKTMDEYFSSHHHQRIIVDGIGHDGQGMYQSDTFKNLLKDMID